MKTNLDLAGLDEIEALVKEIYDLIVAKDHPEKYTNAEDPELVRDFVHTLDLLETILTRFALSVHLARIALREIDASTQVGSL